MINTNVIIGMKTIILKKVTIGDNFFIGARSKVTKHMLSNGIVEGNPSKVIREINNYELQCI